MHWFPRSHCQRRLTHNRRGWNYFPTCHSHLTPLVFGWVSISPSPGMSSVSQGPVNKAKIGDAHTDSRDPIVLKDDEPGRFQSGKVCCSCQESLIPSFFCVWHDGEKLWWNFARVSCGFAQHVWQMMKQLSEFHISKGDYQPHCASGIVMWILALYLKLECQWNASYLLIG